MATAEVVGDSLRRVRVPMPRSLKQLCVCAERHFFGHPGSLKLYHNGAKLITSDDQIKDIRNDDVVVVTWGDRKLNGEQVHEMITSYQSHFPVHEVKSPVVPKRTDPKNLRCPPQNTHECRTTYSRAFALNEPSTLDQPPRSSRCPDEQHVGSGHRPVPMDPSPRSPKEPYVGLGHVPNHFTRGAPWAAEDPHESGGRPTTYAAHYPDRSGPSTVMRPAKRWLPGQVRPEPLDSKTTYDEFSRLRADDASHPAGDPHLLHRRGHPGRLVEEGYTHLADTRRGWYYDDVARDDFHDDTAYTTFFGGAKPLAKRRVNPAPRAGPHLKHQPCPFEKDTEHLANFANRSPDFGQLMATHGPQIYLEPEIRKAPRVLV